MRHKWRVTDTPTAKVGHVEEAERGGPQGDGAHARCASCAAALPRCASFTLSSQENNFKAALKAYNDVQDELEDIEEEVAIRKARGRAAACGLLLTSWIPEPRRL